MALVQPTNLFPSSFRGSGGDVIDASQSNVFSLQLNGTSACVAYALTIMQNDTSSTVVYTVNKTTLTTPIYPRNYQNIPQRLEITIPSTSGMTNGYENGYKWNVTLYWGGATDDESITSADTFFVAQANPSFTVTDPPTTLTTKTLSLAATYTQSDGIPLEWYRWVLTDSSGNTIEDTGEVYSEDIQFIVDGLLSGNTYTYSLTGQTQSGVTVPTVTASFNVEYEQSIVSGVILTSCNNKTGSIAVSYPQLRVILGTASSEDYEYVQKTPIDSETSIAIGDGTQILFNTVNSEPMNFDDDATHIWSGRPTGESSILYTFTESIEGGEVVGELSINNNAITYYYNGVLVLSAERTNYDIRWVIVIMHKDYAIFQFWIRDNILYPDTDLYPSLSLYPSGGVGWSDDGRSVSA